MIITRDDIKEMIEEGKKIIFVGSNVYDFSEFKHPFALNPFYNKIGQDCYKDYKMHGKNARVTWKRFKVGVLREESDVCMIM